MTTTASEINATNAYRFSDSWQIVKTSTDECVGCEHNESEAKVIAAYLAEYHGQHYSLRRNGPDLVRRSLELRNAGAFRVRGREEILAESVQVTRRRK